MSNLLSQASLVMISSGYKEDVVYSQIPTDGSGDLTFTRASNGTRINSAGLVEVCPWNLASYSEDFTNGVWTVSNATITSNSIVAPNGTTTADTISGTTIGAEPRVRQTTAQIGGSVYSLSCYAKKGNVDWVILRNIAVNLGGGSRAWFNLNTGAVGTTNSGISATIESVGNGWYRCTIYGTTDASPTNLIDIAPAPADNDFTTNASGESVYIWGAQLNIGSTAKPYFPTTDRLNVPRLTYQNGGGGCPSLLLEKQSTNLFSYSEQFDNAGWVKGLVSISANTITSPDGTQNADSIIDNTTNSRHVMEQAITGDLSISRAMSLYAKQNTLRYLYMSVTNAGDSHCYSAIFDLQNGTVSATKVNGSATINASIESVGNGWYRCTITGTMTSGTATFYPLIGTSDRGGFTGTLINNNAPSYAGSGQSLYIYGAQLEASSYPTSYIPTTSSSATRVADACYKTGISSLIGQSEGFIAGEVYGLTSAYGALSTIMSVSDGTTQNRVMFSFNPSTGYLTPRIYKAGSTIFVQDYYLGDLTQKIKFAIGWGGGRAVCYVNGTQVQETTGLTFFSSGTLTRLGADQGDGGSIGIGKVSEYILGTTNLTNAQLQSLTL